MIKCEKTPTRPSFAVTIIGDRLPDLDLPTDRRDEAGSGWVRRLRHLLMLRLLDREVHVTDATEPASTLHKIRERWTDDVISRAPDALVIHAGLSDAIGSTLNNNPYAKPAAAAIAVLSDLLERTRKACPSTHIILMEPFINTIDRSPMRSGPWANALPAYVSALREMAAKYNITSIPAGELVSSAKHLRDDDWLGCDVLGMDSNGSILLADHVARLLVPADIPPAPELKDGQTLLFIGDSITDASHRDLNSSRLGKGYVRLLQGLLSARRPELRLNIINKGIGGDTIIDIEGRWDRDVMKYQPDWLILYTGINDINTRYGSRPLTIQPEEYGAGIRRCLDAARAAMPATRFIVATPFFLSLDECKDSYRHELLNLLTVFESAAIRHVDGTARMLHLQPVMVPLLKRYGTRLLGGNLGADTVHPNELCQLALAEAFHNALSTY